MEWFQSPAGKLFRGKKAILKAIKVRLSIYKIILINIGRRISYEILFQMVKKLYISFSNINKFIGCQIYFSSKICFCRLTRQTFLTKKSANLKVSQYQSRSSVPSIIGEKTTQQFLRDGEVQLSTWIPSGKL